jgi:hypothetical protein
MSEQNGGLHPGPEALPLSNAIAEASPESIAELFSRDPEGYAQQDISRIIAELRTARERWAKAEAEKGIGGTRAKPSPKTIPAILASKPSDIGL